MNKAGKCSYSFEDVNRKKKDQIKKIIRERRLSEAEEGILKARVLTEALQSGRLTELTKKLALIEGWLTLPNADEAYILRRHLVDGVDWPRLVFEYNAKWGSENARSERTLRRYQDHALQKIIDFNEAQGLLDE